MEGKTVGIAVSLDMKKGKETRTIKLESWDGGIGACHRAWQRTVHTGDTHKMLAGWPDP